MENALLPEDYYSQRNNSHRPYYECGNTSLANLLCCTMYPETFRRFKTQLDNYLYEWLRKKTAQNHAKKFGQWAMRTPEQVPEMLRFAAENLSGLKHSLSWNTNRTTIIEKVPMIVATRFYKGQKNGHYVLVGGADKTGVIIDDPFGDPLTEYKDYNGYGISMSWEIFDRNFDGIAIYKD